MDPVCSPNIMSQTHSKYRLGNKAGWIDGLLVFMSPHHVYTRLINWSGAAQQGAESQNKGNKTCNG